MFTFIWADGQASAVESLKTQNSNVKVQLNFSHLLIRMYCRMALTQMSMPKPMMSHHSHWLSVLFTARLCWMPTPPPPPP